jgi:hypothetical protein
LDDVKVLVVLKELIELDYARVVDDLHNGYLILDHLELCSTLVSALLNHLESTHHVQLLVPNFFDFPVATLANDFEDFIVDLDGVASMRDQHARIDDDIELVLLDLIHVALKDVLLNQAYDLARIK